MEAQTLALIIAGVIGALIVGGFVILFIIARRAGKISNTLNIMLMNKDKARVAVLEQSVGKIPQPQRPVPKPMPVEREEVVFQTDDAVPQEAEGIEDDEGESPVFEEQEYGVVKQKIKPITKSLPQQQPKMSVEEKLKKARAAQKKNMIERKRAELAAMEAEDGEMDG